MTRRRRRVLAILLAGSLPSCGGGGGSPTGPSTPTPSGFPVGTTLTFVSGETGQPAVGATLNVNGHQYQTDGSGLIRLNEEVALRTSIDVTHADYLDRLTVLRSASETRFTLWPRTNAHGLSEDFTSRIVYSDSDVEEATGTSPLYRIAPGHLMNLRPTPEILNDPKLRPLVEEAADIVNDASGQGIFALDPSGSAAGGVFTISLEPQNRSCDEDTYAFASFSGSNVTITGGEIIFCESLSYFHQAPASRDLRDYFLGTMVHELGHAYGLNHSGSDRDLMYIGGHWYKYERDHRFFSDRETTVMRLMWERRAGTRFPDNDRSATGTLGRFTRTIKN